MEFVFVDPGPVGKTVKAVPVDRELSRNREDEFGCKGHGLMGGGLLLVRTRFDPAVIEHSIPGRCRG